jgi:hypothetical protein
MEVGTRLAVGVTVAGTGVLVGGIDVLVAAGGTDVLVAGGATMVAAGVSVDGLTLELTRIHLPWLVVAHAYPPFLIVYKVYLPIH